jgi:hypothetical protein
MTLQSIITDTIQEELALGGDAKSCASAVLSSLAEDIGLREEYAVVSRHSGDVAEVCVAGTRWVSDWQNIEAAQLA